MRLGLVSIPDAENTAGKLDLLERGAFLLLEREQVERVIYLGNDLGMESVVEQVARRLVGTDPTDDAAWARAAELAAQGDPGEIDEFIKRERLRARLRCLESLPPRIWRTMEMIVDRVAIILYDKGMLDEEDIFSANMLIFGKNDGPMMRKIGTRWFVSPGLLGAAGGLALIDDTDDIITFSIFDAMGTLLKSQVLDFGRPAKMTVHSG